MGNVLYIDNWPVYKMFKDLRTYKESLSKTSDKDLIGEIDKIIFFLKSPSCDLFQVEMAFLLIKELLQRLASPNSSTHLKEFSALAKKLEKNLARIKEEVSSEDHNHFKL